MDKIELKKALVDSQNQLIMALQKSLADAKSGLDLDDEDTKDVEDFSHQEEYEESARSLELRIEQAQQILVKMKQLPFESFDKVDYGALVMVNGMYFLMGVPFPDFQFDGHKIIGVSDQAPIYPLIHGLKKGDAYEFNGKKSLIESVM